MVVFQYFFKACWLFFPIIFLVSDITFLVLIELYQPLEKIGLYE